MKQSKSIAPDRDARFMSRPAIDAEYVVDSWRILPRPPKWLLLPFSASFGSFGWRDWLILAIVVVFWGGLIVSMVTLPSRLPPLWGG